MSWDQRFSEPILLTDGRKLRTVRDAANYVTRLPKAEQQAPQWQLSAEMLLLVGERGGDTMMPRIAMLKALHRNVPRSQSAQRRKHVKSFRVIR